MTRAGKILIYWLIVLLYCSAFSYAAIEPKKRDLQWAYMMSFIRYFSWPDEKAHPQVKVCIIGHNPFVVDEDDFSLHNKSGKITVIEHYPQLPTIEAMILCRVIYFSASVTTAQLSFVFSKLKIFPVVTIGEHQGFINIGGILQFTEQENKLHFRLNKAALSTMNLKVHPSLLRLSD